MVNDVDAALFEAAEEKALFEQMTALHDLTIPALAKGDYTTALEALSTLRDVVDAFFDNVMVMADNEAVKNNRLALLKQLRGMFVGIADISVL